jgi:hypothetical protein
MDRGRGRSGERLRKLVISVAEGSRRLVRSVRGSTKSTYLAYFATSWGTPFQESLAFR